jgi:hypothetical protein
MDDWINHRSGPMVGTERLKQLSRRSDLRGLLQLSSQVAALGVTSTLMALAHGKVWLVLPFVAQGMVLNGLYTGQHEMSHRTAFRSRWLNQLFGAVIGFVMFLPAGWDQKFHFAHHRNQDPERAPELLAYAIRSLKAWRISLLGLPFGWGQAKAMAAAGDENHVSAAEHRLPASAARYCARLPPERRDQEAFAAAMLAHLTEIESCLALNENDDAALDLKLIFADL